MTVTAKSVLKSALALPESERMAIADALLESLPEDLGDLDNKALLEELKNALKKQSLTQVPAFHGPKLKRCGDQAWPVG